MYPIKRLTYEQDAVRPGWLNFIKDFNRMPFAGPRGYIFRPDFFDSTGDRYGIEEFMRNIIYVVADSTTYTVDRFVEKFPEHVDFYEFAMEPIWKLWVEYCRGRGIDPGGDWRDYAKYYMPQVIDDDLII